jgi:outer membrane protein OmpA-like peptidoglycan-associated protein
MNARFSLPAPLLLALAAAVCARPAAAQSRRDAFELERLSPSPFAGTSLVANTGDGLPSAEARFSLIAHYEREPLLVHRAGALLGDVVGHRVTGHLTAAWAPFQRLLLGAQAPVVAWQKGDDLTAYGVERPASLALGTPVMSARFLAFHEAWGSPLDLALDLGVGLPLGSTSAYASDDRVTLSPSLGLGKSLGPLRVGASGGVTLRPTRGLGTDDIGSAVHGDLSLTTLGDGWRWELTGRFALPTVGTDLTSVEALAGPRIPLGDWELFVLGGPGFGNGMGTPLFRVLVGLARNWREPAPLPPALQPAPSKQPAPAPRLPAEGVTAVVVEKALPPPPSPACTEGTDYPLEACPVLDKDGDGVPNGLDKCPLVPGKALHFGCPTPVVEFTKEKLVIDEAIQFNFGEAKIQASSFELLDRVAEVLLEHPEAGRVIIEGHTDGQSGAADKLKLGQRRAEAVRDYLVKKGLKKAQLEPRGFGPTRAISRDKTAEGRDQNRRVVFRFELEQPVQHQQQ